MILLNIFIIISIIVLLIRKEKLQETALSLSFVSFILSIFLLLIKPVNSASFLITQGKCFQFLGFSIDTTLGLDGLSIMFIILSTLLTTLCVLTAETIRYRKKFFLVLLFLTELLLVNVFSVLDAILFYVLFESTLIPVFMIIGIWGSRQEKITAAYQFFIYTLMGSLLMLLSLIFMVLMIGSTNLFVIKTYQFSLAIEKIIFITFFLAFAVKVPMFPFHLWLPKAHVEAPTAGSVLLAGILLKLGGYGFIRFSLDLFPSALEYFRPFIIVLALFGTVYSSIIIFRQIDLKRIIAYSSISHMNFAILGCVIGSKIALVASIMLMIAHGLVSAGLFFLVGFLYDRYHSRNIMYFRGLVSVMPIFTIMFFVLTLANLGFPPTLNFMSEFVIIMELIQWNIFSGFISGIALFFAGISGFWVYTRIFFGNYAFLNGKYHIKYFYDLTVREFCSIFPLVILTFLLGIKPKLITSWITFNLGVWGI